MRGGVHGQHPYHHQHTNAYGDWKPYDIIVEFRGEPRVYVCMCVCVCVCVYVCVCVCIGVHVVLHTHAYEASCPCQVSAHTYPIVWPAQ